MSAYKIEKSSALVAGKSATLLRVAFGDAAGNDSIVRAVEARMVDLETDGLTGPLVLVNGPTSFNFCATDGAGVREVRRHQNFPPIYSLSRTWVDA